MSKSNMHCCRCRKLCENLALCSGVTTRCDSTVPTLTHCVRGPRQWASSRGPRIRIRRRRTRMTAHSATSAPVGTTSTSTAWLSRTPLFTSTPTVCIIAYCSRGSAVRWTRNVWHLLEHRLVICL